MTTRTHIVVTFGATLLAIAALIMFGQTPAPATVDDTAHLVTASHCIASVDEYLDWYSEGIAAEMPSHDDVQVMYDACGYFGPDSEADGYEDGSWRVMAGDDGVIGENNLPIAAGTYWTGCFAVGTCAD